jgi:hypothetical protein
MQPCNLIHIKVGLINLPAYMHRLRKCTQYYYYYQTENPIQFDVLLISLSEIREKTHLSLYEQILVAAHSVESQIVLHNHLS